MIGRNGKRGSRISALAAQHDDDDDMAMCKEMIIIKYKLSLLLDRNTSYCI